MTDTDLYPLVDDFMIAFAPWGSRDVHRAIQVMLESLLANDYDIVDDLVNLVESFAEKTDSKFENIDVVYVVYDHILQMARNHINEITGFDFLNDGAEIETHGNYLCSQYDWREENREVFIKKFNSFTKEQQEKILSCEVTRWFLAQIEVYDKA